MSATFRRSGFTFLFVFLGWCATVAGQGADVPGVRVKAQKDMKNGNWKDAYEGFRKICLEKENSGREVAQDLSNPGTVVV